MSGTEGTRVALDTNAIIELFERASSASRQLAAMVAACSAGGVPVVVSELAFAEVLVKPLRLGRAVDVEDYERLFASGGRLAVHPVDRLVLRTSARLKASNTGLKLPDAIHAATAVVAGVDVLLTSDQRLARLDWSLALRDRADGASAPSIVDPLTVDVTTLVEPR